MGPSELVREFNRDRRNFVILALTVILLIGVYVVGPPVLPSVLILLVSTIAIDALATYALHRSLKVSKSGIVSGLILAMVLNVSPEFWYAGVFASAVAVLQKHLLHVRGRHIFNPAAIGALAAAAVFPTMALQAWWAPAGLGALAMGLLGLVAVHRQRRFHLLLAFALVHAAVVAAAHGQGVVGHLLGLLQSGTFWLFSTIILIEPVTTPVSWNGRLAFGALVGVLAYALTLHPATAPFSYLGAIAVSDLAVPLLNKYVR